MPWRGVPVEILYAIGIALKFQIKEDIRERS
jgi:hypothetical protein